jgi:hypothetical protein
MRRWILRIAICLILGAATTVAVAWGFTAVTLDDSSESVILGFDDSPIHAYIDEQTVEARCFVARRTLGSLWIDGIFTSDLSERLHNLDMPADQALQLARDRTVFETPSWSVLRNRATCGELDQTRAADRAFGWPALSLQTSFVAQQISGGAVTIQWIGGIPMREGEPMDFGARGRGMAPHPGEPKALPLRPIWPGFLIDILIYAAIWAGLFFGFTSAKRFIRTRCGRCPRCAYDLRGDLAAGCSECGWNR